MTGICLRHLPSLLPANSQAEADKEKKHARAEVIEHLDLITGWIFAGKKEKRNMALKPANYP
jgi:hypothetical protein